MCKLVKMAPDAVEGATIRRLGQPYGLGRFGSTICYPASLVVSPIVSVYFGEVEHL